MKLALFFFYIYAVAFSAFWVLGLLYGLLRRPAVYFPARLAATMAAAGLAGLIIGGFGGPFFSTLVMDRAFARRDDYRALPVIVAGGLISVIALVVTGVAFYALAWNVFG